MVEQRLAYLVCRPPDDGKTVVEVASSVIAAPDRDGMAFSDALETDMPVSVGLARSRHAAEPESEGTNPPVRAHSLINKKIVKPLAVRAERHSGMPPTEESLCVYLRQ
ncbi:hypothetical protein [uncultured Arthrobacter sp.]|uniref:hypothetical protein n=1 Tax=uncultured Arthrobacter sp. TaxID=114050 RepID=UPI003216C448